MAKVITYGGAQLYPKQRAAIYDANRWSLIEASTKSGKTIGCLSWLLEEALKNGRRGRNYWWVSPVFGQAFIGFERMRDRLPKGLYKQNQSVPHLMLANGAKIVFKSAERCYDDQTEILTNEGWKFFRALNRDERVMTLDLERRTAEWQYPSDYIDSAYAGPMRKFQSEKVDLLVTPNHKFPTVNRDGTRSFLTLDEMTGRDYIPRRVEWIGNTEDSLSHDDCAFMGIFLAEGSAAGCSGGTTAVASGNYTIHISQSPGIKGGKSGVKGDVRSKIRELLERLGHNVNETPEGLLIRNKDLWTKLLPLGNRYEKRIPARYKELPPEKLRTLLWWMVLGDGSINEKGRMEAYFTASKGLADDVQEVAIKAGLSATISVRKQTVGGVNKKGRQIASTTPLYDITFHSKRNDYVQSSTRRYVKTEMYAGRIYCVTVPNHAVLVRRNGRMAWSGNSNDLYGEDVYAAVLDEASRMREDSLIAMRSTITATRGPIRIIGNVVGRKNWFYRLCRAAEAGASDMAFHRITCWDAVEAGVLQREEIEASRREFELLGRLGAWMQLYMAEAADEGDNPFGLQAIENCVLPDVAGPSPDGDGNFVWGHPADLTAKVAGVDLAGRGAQNINPSAETVERDYSAITKLDADGVCTHLERFRKGHTETTARIVGVLGRTDALVDSTGTGDAIVENLQRRGDMRVEGYTFTERSRQDLLEGLALAIQGMGILFPDGPLRDELDAHEYVYTRGSVYWRVPPGYHDDLVMSLALAVKKLPWKRRAAPPSGVSQDGGSRWHSQNGGAPATDPLKSPAAPTPVVSVPVLVSRTGGGGRWTGADR